MGVVGLRHLTKDKAVLVLSAERVIEVEKGSQWQHHKHEEHLGAECECMKQFEFLGERHPDRTDFSKDFTLLSFGEVMGVFLNELKPSVFSADASYKSEHLQSPAVGADAGNLTPFRLGLSIRLNVKFVHTLKPDLCVRVSR